MKYFLKRLLQNVGFLILVCAIVYIFLGVCNWSYKINEWTGLSRFVFAGVALIMIITTFQAMCNTITNIKNKTIKS